MMTKLYIALAFFAGAGFYHSLVGEYARYGRAINEEIEYCELINQRECDYITAPVSEVPDITPSTSSKDNKEISIIYKIGPIHS